jgi:hypothetical protein
MRAPTTARRHLTRIHVGVRVHFSPDHYQAIADSLTEAGVDADAVPALLDKIESLARGYSLRSYLVSAGRLRANKERLRANKEPTPRKRIKQLRRDIRDLDIASGVVARYRPDVWRGLRAMLEQELQELQAAPKPRRQRVATKTNRRHVYTDYLIALARLFQATVPNSSHKRLREFLRVCTEPVFPTVLRDPQTGKPTDNVLNSFTDYLVRKSGRYIEQHVVLPPILVVDAQDIQRWQAVQSRRTLARKSGELSAGFFVSSKKIR